MSETRRASRGTGANDEESSSLDRMSVFVADIPALQEGPTEEIQD